jgi:hypothetical protein
MTTPKLEKIIYHFQDVHRDKPVQQFLAGEILSKYYRGELDALFCEGIHYCIVPIDIDDFPINRDGSDFVASVAMSNLPIFGAEEPDLNKENSEQLLKLVELQAKKINLYMNWEAEFCQMGEQNSNGEDPAQQKAKANQLCEQVKQELAGFIKEKESIMEKYHSSGLKRSEFMVQHALKVSEQKGYSRIGISAGMGHNEEIRVEVEKRGHIYVPIIPDISHIDEKDKGYLESLIAKQKMSIKA